MKTRIDNQLLRTLDPATGVTDTAQRERADALLERIVASDPAAQVAPAAFVRRPAARRTLLARGVGAAAAASVLAVAGVTLLDRGGPAFASWTPTPSSVSAADLALVEEECRDRLDDDWFDPNTIPRVLAERRGDFVAMLFHTNTPDISASCVAFSPAGSGDVDHVRTGAGGSSGPAWTPDAGRITEGAISDFRAGDGRISFTDGAIGDGVVGVTIRTEDGLTVTTSIADGRYAAWWPGRSLSDPEGPSGYGGPEPTFTYDVTLADGTVLRDVDPQLPR